MHTLLGLESSCDDTAAAVVAADGTTAAGFSPEGRPFSALMPRGTILANVVLGQGDLHAPHGGVVPEIAARAHAERLDVAARQALDEAGMTLGDLDGIAVTAGPGLVGGVLAGVMFAKGLAAGTGLPLWGINHLAGHALTPRMTHALAFPYLMLLVSGGHCQFLVAEAPNLFRRLGGTIDDAPGEAFDKVARLLGLPQPGGPAVEAEAAAGDPDAVPLPRPMLGRPGCDVSFSGLKTAVLHARDAALLRGTLPREARADICAAFQAAVRDVLAARTRDALAMAGPVTALAVSGGVAANRALRGALEDVTDLPFAAPPMRLCTDNGAMIAWAAHERVAMGDAPDDMTLAARPRWPLDLDAAPMLGSGRRGAKA